MTATLPVTVDLDAGVLLDRRAGRRRAAGRPVRWSPRPAGRWSGPGSRPPRSGSRGRWAAGRRRRPRPGRRSTASVMASRSAAIGALGQLGDEEQRAVEAGAEAVDQQVVGLLGGGVLGVVALVGEPEPQRQHRDGAAAGASAAADERRRPRPVLDDAGSSGRRVVSRSGLGGRCGTSRFSGATKKPGDEHDDRQRDADEQRRDLRGRRRPAPRRARPAAIRPRQRVSSMRSPAKPSSAGSSVSDASTVTATTAAAPTARPWTKADAHQEHAEQRDHDGRAGEQHRAAGGVDGDRDRLAHGVAARGAARGSG